MRTAGRDSPPMSTDATPSSVDSFRKSTFSEYSFTTESGNVLDESRIVRIGWSAGLAFRTCGGCGMSRGNPPVACTAA